LILKKIVYEICVNQLGEVLFTYTSNFASAVHLSWHKSAPHMHFLSAREAAHVVLDHQHLYKLNN